MMFLYGSGNRDERQYGRDAGELDVTRKPRNILTFSHGAHHCLGAAAARMQSRVALEELVDTHPRLRGRRGRNRLGGRQLRPTTAVDAVLGQMMAGDWLAERRTEVAADRILDAADELFTAPRCGHRGDERNRQGRRMFPCHGVPLLREPRRAAHRVRAPRDPSGVQCDGPTHISHRRSASAPARRHDCIAAQRPRKPGSVFVVRSDPASDRWRDGRTLRCDQGADRSISGVAGDRRRRAARTLVGPRDDLAADFPGPDDADERAMLEEFVLPMVAPKRMPRTPSTPAP